MTDWAAYAEKLRKAIEENDGKGKNLRGIILDADNYYERLGKKSGGRAAFKLRSSGACQKKFVTLWELFDHHDLLEECADMLTRKIRELRKEDSFTTIVTCTQPSRYLAQKIHEAIEEPLNAPTDSDQVDMVFEEEVRLRHLGPDHESPEAFSGEKVLIVSDVVATGFLTNYVAKTISDLGGTPVGILCIVNLLDPQKPSTGNLKELYPLSRLTDLEIPTLKPDEYDADKTLSIDPATVLPEEGPSAETITPLFNTQEMFRHFDGNGALDFGFFELNSRSFTAALRVPLLFEQHGDGIWEKLEALIPENPLLVTTCNRTDLAFKAFVAERVEKRDGHKHDCVLIPRMETLGSSDAFFPPPSHAQRLEGRDAILLVSTIQTSDNFRNLCSILASQGVTRITTLCLFNRMGVHTTDFVARVRSLLRGIQESKTKDQESEAVNDEEASQTIEPRHYGRDSSAEDPADEVPFELYPVYNFAELPVADIKHMQALVDQLFGRYSKATQVESFRRLTSNYRKYFKSQSLTSYRFSQGRPTLLPDVETENVPRQEKVFDDSKVEIWSYEGLLFVRCINLVATKDYGPLIDEVDSVDDKETLFKLFGLLMSDIRFIRLTGQFDRLRLVITARLQRLKDERLALEAESPNLPVTPPLAEQLQEKVDLEIYLLLGLALFAYLDHGPDGDYDYSRLAERLLTCDLTVGQWSKYPMNLLIYLGDERLAWLLSMLLHLSNPGFERPEIGTDLKDRMTNILRHYNKKLVTPAASDFAIHWQAAGWKEEFLKALNAKVEINFNSMLADLGKYQLQNRYSVLRFLHKELVSQPSRHSPISGTLSQVIGLLEQIVFGRLRQQKIPEIQKIAFRKEDKGSLQPLLEDGMYIAGRLEEIAEATERLFDFTSISKEHSGMFFNVPGGSEFKHKVRRIGDILESARITNSMSHAELVELRDLNLVVLGGLWDRHSALQKVLRSYIVHLDEVLLSTLQEANRQLNAEGYPEVWSPFIEGFDEFVGDKKRWRVLVDRMLLREVLRNMLLNVKHGLEAVKRKQRNGENELVYSQLVGLSLQERETEKNGISKVRWVRLTVVSRGKAYIDPQEAFSTITQHASNVAEYGERQLKDDESLEPEVAGGFLSFEPTEGNEATIATLDLRSRRDLFERTQRDEERESSKEGKG